MEGSVNIVGGICFEKGRLKLKLKLLTVIVINIFQTVNH